MTWKLNATKKQTEDILKEEIADHIATAKQLADMTDAAEFEARVAKKLAQFAETNEFDCPTCPLGFDCTKESEDFCVWRILKEARLAVEAEMDK